MDRVTPQGYDFPGKVNNPFWGGSGGTSDYEELDNLPQINGNTLIGDKSSDELEIVAPLTEEQITLLKNLI